jgi:AcrR family transcriptional regulator
MSRTYSLGSGGRTNQKARTRSALLQAATELVREGQPPSIPNAAERAMISVATAYRYFTSAEDLWWEASASTITQAAIAHTDALIMAAGDDPQARLEAFVRDMGFHMLDNQALFRRVAKAALERWFAQADSDDAEKAPVREGRRNKHIGLILEPLRGRLPKKTVDRVAHALGVIVGTDAMIALTDGVGLDVPAAKKAMLDAGRWLLAGALAEVGPKAPKSRETCLRK